MWNLEGTDLQNPTLRFLSAIFHMILPRDFLKSYKEPYQKLNRIDLGE